MYVYVCGWVGVQASKPQPKSHHNHIIIIITSFFPSMFYMLNKLHKHHRLCGVWLNLSSSLLVLIMTNNYSNMAEITDGGQYIKSISH